MALVAIRPPPATAAATAVTDDETTPVALATNCTRFLNYQLVAVAGPDHPLATGATGAAGGAGVRELREQTWLSGPSAVGRVGMVPSVLRCLGVPEHNQRIFQSHAAAVEEAKRGKGVSLAVAFTVAKDIAGGGAPSARRPRPPGPRLLERPHPRRPRGTSDGHGHRPPPPRPGGGGR